ncbi:hypothetical protein BDN72DRAFT_848826 [Pluteus cervinus]|uniref:Uncharacterized protein n=2 Tax=Pluteus cervinus TaxID=181527 RepID=A0ACD3A9C1_9AGAR|nr:hypothetical protein BDN72DRAFT_848858 [Pluteus cervinus]TFK62323.1 hypothetical protein BDN72DRAFT_848826 [Pluteus cervinus]
MKRLPSRAPSPTPTSFSGISNYRTESTYRKNVTSTPIDYRQVSKKHFTELSQYLAAYLARTPANSRSTARQKLTRLTIQQFHELSTDVYDELMRRKDERQVPFLPVREDFHPKRNQARQKLATLPASRFEDLSSDVYYELSRRYPEFNEDPSGRGSASSNYDDYPAPDFPSSSPPRNNRTSGRTSADRPADSGYGGSVSSRRPSQDRRRPNDVEYSQPRRSDDSYSGGRPSDDGYSSRRKISLDNPRRSDERDRDYPRRPSAASGTTDSTSTATAAQATTATSGMIIPNKSTIEEEYIEVPYGREVRDSSGTMMDEREGSRVPSRDNGRPSGNVTDNELDSASEYPSPLSPRSPPAGLNGLSARLRGVSDDEDDLQPNGFTYGRASANSDRGAPAGIGSRLISRASMNDDQEKMKKDYESRIATMQSQISSLQRDVGDSTDKDRKLRDSEARVRQLEEELGGFRKRFEEQSSTMRNLQKELEDLRETRQRERDREARRARDDEEEMQILRDRLERLEEERASAVVGVDTDMVDQLRSDMEALMLELSDLSKRNDELMTAKDADLVVIRDLDIQLKEYKRKYEQAKTELRGFKATSQLFVQPPRLDKSEDQLPVTSDGGVVDIHVTAFLSATDALLTAGRHSSPTRVLGPMRSVVNAVSAIIDDVRAYERRPLRERGDIDMDSLRALRERLDSTLSNLTTASKTHASSSGMSPVSLLDAAASHVSTTVTDVVRTISIRKATKAEQDSFHAPGPTATNGFSPSLSSVGENRPSHMRNGSATSSSSRGRLTDNPPTSPPVTRNFLEARRRPPSANSSSENTNSPPPIFDRQTNSTSVTSDDSAIADGPEDAWSELKPYLEAQTESIVYAIQAVLSGVRSPTPLPNLSENLTQIITIVSSIVAVCNDNLPPGSVQQGTEILQELSDHANKLSEVQAQPEVTKESRQVMAKSSFAIANAMKGLMKL